ncbi:conserved hypothetical protein [Trichinella spiralis]|uniref:hypothetical protein n=1 Tax=Trichinella spiralis TaxID=6334 RepID=UPI0001EFD648|nr:conserved hypothetical protein [Trichinella spiralis]
MHTHTRNVCRLSPRQAAFKRGKASILQKCTLVMIGSSFHVARNASYLQGISSFFLFVLRLNLFLQLNVQHIECQLENLLWYVVCVCHMWNANCIQIVCDSFGATNTNTTNNNNIRRRVYV